VPDETTILNFRHWLEKNKIAEEMFEGVNLLLQDFGLMVRQGTIVDATIIDAPSSTKNAEGARDPDLVHAVVGTPANAADVTQVAGLLHGEEALVFGDAGYQGVDPDRNVDLHGSEGFRQGGHAATLGQPRGMPLSTVMQYRHCS